MPEYVQDDEFLDEIVHYNSLIQDRVLRVRIQKRNKKEWNCLNCSYKIPVGEGSAYFTGLSCGQFYEYHLCLKCYEGTKGDIIKNH